MTPPRTPQIPVVVLAGFLGSGKTTLLNHLLRNRAGNRVGVIVNDFGSIEIDAMTVAGQVGSTVSLGNGCLCCAVDASELGTFLSALTRPAARLDVIVIDASGLAEPQGLVRMLLASDNQRIRYGGQVVHAAEFVTTRKRHPELDRHLAGRRPHRAQQDGPGGRCGTRPAAGGCRVDRQRSGRHLRLVRVDRPRAALRSPAPAGR